MQQAVKKHNIDIFSLSKQLRFWSQINACSHDCLHLMDVTKLCLSDSCLHLLRAVSQNQNSKLKETKKLCKAEGNCDYESLRYTVLF